MYDKESIMRWRETHREEYNAYHREYYRTHREQYRTTNKLWRQRHPEHLEWRRAYNRAWYAKNKAKKGEGNDES